MSDFLPSTVNFTCNARLNGNGDILVCKDPFIWITHPKDAPRSVSSVTPRGASWPSFESALFKLEPQAAGPGTSAVRAKLGFRSPTIPGQSDLALALRSNNRLSLVMLIHLETGEATLLTVNLTVNFQSAPC